MVRLFLAAVILTGCAGQTLPDRVTASAVSGTPQAIFEGIARGSSALVEVRLNNPGEQPIEITTINMSVLSVRPTSCPTTALQLVSYPKPIIAAKSTGTVLVKIAVAKDAVKACSKARWQVSFASQATPAS